MNNGTNNFQNFIGISSLQKTLRNALIPTETTQQFIVKNGIIKEDELRGENRQILKDIMDDYYRGFISETLSSIDDIDWTSLFEKMEIQLKNGDNKDTLIKEQAEKRKAIYKKFADDDRFKNMFSAKLISDILPEFVIHNNNYSASEKEEKTQVIKLFSRFATSFKDYFKNRANCFSADDISSSSCHRIVNDNAEIFFSNALVYRRIVKNLSNDDINKISGDMKDSLKEMSLEEIYSYEKYGKFITQEGISFYNDICGKVNLFHACTAYSFLLEEKAISIPLTTIYFDGTIYVVLRILREEHRHRQSGLFLRSFVFSGNTGRADNLVKEWEIGRARYPAP